MTTPITEFKAKIKEISDLAFSNAVLNLEAETKKSAPQEWTNDFKTKFVHLVHEGFKKAQLILVDEICFYQNKLEECNSDLKIARRERNKSEENRLKGVIKDVEFRIKLLYSIGDGIAWQMLGNQVHILRRFYTNDTPKTLKQSNIQHALEVAGAINKDPNDFALITDLTNFVQISDLIVLSGGEIGILELKEGAVNDELKKIKEDLFSSSNPKEKLEEIESTLDPKKLKQFFRMLKQDIKMIETINTINNNEGIDIKTGKNIKLLTPEHITETYTGKISETILKLENKTWSYSVDYGGIIQIGVYKKESFQLSLVAIPSILSESKYKIIVDYSSIIENLSEPLFAKPFSPDVINSIQFGDLKIIIGLDLDKFFQDFEKFFGIKTRVLSRKETMKLKELDKENAKHIFIIENQAFEFTDVNSGKSMILGGGIISKIIYDNISPLTIYMDVKQTLR